MAEEKKSVAETQVQVKSEISGYFVFR